MMQSMGRQNLDANFEENSDENSDSDEYDLEVPEEGIPTGF